MTKTTDTAMPALLLGEAGSDPIEDRLREKVRATIEAMFEEELAAFLGRLRYGRGGGARKGIATGGASASSSAPSAPRSSACRAPASRARTARPPNGGRRRCRAISG